MKAKLPLIAFISLVFLVCFRPIVAFRLYTVFDDLCYATWTAKLLGLSPGTCSDSSHPPGAALMWLPAGLLTLFKSGWNSDLFMDALPIWVALLSFFYWAASGVIFGSFLFLFAVPVLYYGTHRTTMVHAPEIFLVSLLVYFSQKKETWKATVTSFILVALRLNDLPALLFPLVLFGQARSNRKSDGKWIRGVLVLLMAGLGAYLALKGYNSTHLTDVLRRLKLSHAARVFFGSDWGIVYTAPFWLFSMVFGCIYFKKISPLCRAGLAWMFFELVICIAWRGNGSDFGYRYLIGSYAGAFLLWKEMAQPYVHRWWRNWAQKLMGVNAAVLFWMNWIYKEFPSVTPAPTRKLMWFQADLLWNSLRELFHVQSYWAPLLHSPFAALYFTFTDPQSDYALSGGVSGLAFWVLLGVTLGAVGGVILGKNVRGSLE